MNLKENVWVFFSDLSHSPLCGDYKWISASVPCMCDFLSQKCSFSHVYRIRDDLAVSVSLYD